MDHTSTTHADTKAFAVSAMLTLRAGCYGDIAVAGLAAGKLYVVVGVSQEKRLQQQHNS